MKLKKLPIALATILAAQLGSTTVLADNKRMVDVVVKLKHDQKAGNHNANIAAANGLARSMGVDVKHAYGSAFFGFSASIPEGRLNGLQNNPNVEYVEVDRTWSLPPVVQAPPFGGGGADACDSQQCMPWGISRTGADSNNNEGAGVHVYVIDTGIDVDHADLAASLGNGFAAESCKGRDCLADWDDDHGHGTHVAGTVGAIDNGTGVIGVAAEVTLHGLKVCNKRGSCPNSSTIAAIDWMANEVATRGEAAVANMSLGGSGSKTGTCTDSGFTGNDSYHEAICNAKNAGVVFVVAAGNEGADADTKTPAGYDDAVITVSATSEGDDWASWSNYGNNTASWTSNTSAPVAIAAPGVNILSLAHGGGTTSMSGTSMASPHVAGAAALYLASNPQAADGSAFTNTRNALLNRAENTSGFNNTSGKPHSEDFMDAGNL